ncbi:MAG: hypothetical protein HY042_13290 [Spirochaetia bacterium]|nr:hypothetical protein [Spirochaetia bacterium]
MNPVLTQIVDKIREANETEGEGSIPTSDTIYRKSLYSISETEENIRSYLQALTDAHYIFAIKLVENDEKMGISGIDGYVVAEIPILAAAKERSFRELEMAYEHQFYKRKHALVICRELVGDARKFNNTPMGRLLNLAVMLQQFEHLMVTAFHEFSDTWREKVLARKLGGVTAAEPPVSFLEEEPTDAITDAPLQPFQRAVDSGEYKKIQEMNKDGKWGEAVDRFGVQFLLRIHFRKMEFDVVKALMKSKKIAREEDLKYVRDTLRTMESRMSMDPGLAPHANVMTELRRMAQIRMNQIHLAKKEPAHT